MASRRGEVVLAGYLTKSPPDSRSAVSQWRRRWFVLADSKIVYPLAARYVRFEYYANEDDAKSFADPKGVINLQVCKSVISREPYRGHKHVFDVVTSDRVYHLDAESAADKDEWVNTLCRLLFGGENQQSSSSSAAGGGGAPSFPLAPHPDLPSPPSPTEMYMSNSTYSEHDFTACEAVASNGRDAAIQGASRPLPPPPPASRHDVRRHSENDDTIHASFHPTKEESRKISAPLPHASPQMGGHASQEDSKKASKQPPKVLPYKQHKKVAQACADYETMEDEDDTPPPLPPPNVASKKSAEVQDDDYSVADEGAPRIPGKKKSDGRVETKPEPQVVYDSDYSLLQASPSGDISDDYSHLDLSSASNENTHSNRLKHNAGNQDDDYSHLSH